MPIFNLVGLFYYFGQVNFVFGQVKIEDHLPRDRQYYNLNVEPC